MTIFIMLDKNIFLITLSKTITNILFKLNFTRSFFLKKEKLKKKAAASLLKHKNGFFGQKSKRKVLRIKRYVENMLIKKN